jgi:uncharacterized protein (TIGR02246 family)
MEPARRPEDCDRLFDAHLAAGDLEALVQLYEPGCRLVRRDGSVVAGHPEIRLVLGRLLGMKPAFSLRVVKVVETGDDLALVYNDWSLVMARLDGTRIETSGKAVEVVRRQPDGSWRFVIDDPFARG